jgi:hypothetical protein
MIDTKFGLFWSGGKLSFLRYLTFKTLRHFHPNSVIELYTSEKFNNNVNWVEESQDFENEIDSPCYMDKLKDLNIEIKEFDEYPNYASNFQSDFFRWWWLKNNNGFYLDTDQIILKSFDEMDLDFNLICSVYKAQSCGTYSPVGVIGAENSEIVSFTNEVLDKFYDGTYNSLGPFMFIHILNHKKWNDKILNTSSKYFYPIPESFMVRFIYEGRFTIPEESYALHWFGGAKESQKFNSKYTEDFMKSSSDTISLKIKEMGLF